MSLSQSFFAQKFGIGERDLESYLSEALSAGGEYADLYFEYLATSSIGIDEGIVKSATEGVESASYALGRSRPPGDLERRDQHPAAAAG